MQDIKELEKQGLLEALELEESELTDAKINLLGFFDVLHKIETRLKKEAGNRKEEGSYD